jgi:hypothetical protein
MDIGTQYLALLNDALTRPIVYDQMNALRDRFNQLGSRFDLYLEDNWNDPVPGETHFEYRLRSLDTKDDLGPLGIDVYTNRRDGKGVWHLGDYQHSFWLLQKTTDENPVIPHPDYAILSLHRVLQFLKTHRVD